MASLSVLAASTLVLTGCSPVDVGGGNGPGDVGRADGVVTIYGAMGGDDAALLEESWAGWAQEHNITIKYKSIDDFDTQIGVRAAGGKAPDLAIFSHPNVLSDLVARDLIQRAPKGVKSNVRKYWSNDWANYVTTDGVFYGAPLLANVKGLIWYSPIAFAAYGWKVPTTWDELLALTADMRQKLQVEPWCAGFGSDAQAGTLGADWIEDLVLREAGPHTYDEWVAHRVSFSDPVIHHAFESLEELLLGTSDSSDSGGSSDSSDSSDASVTSHSKAGFADIAPMTAASGIDVATAMGAGTCALAHQPLSFANTLIDPQAGNTSVSPQGAMWAFLMPSMNAGGNSVTGGGSIVAAFSNDADTVAVQKYLSSPEWANIRVKLGGVISANNGVDPAVASAPILKKAMQILQDPRTVFRFDGSGQMPKAVGSGSFPAGMVAWVGGASLAKVLSTIDKSWPTP